MVEKKDLSILLDETNQLVTTLQRLKKEIESYDEAKQNLEGVKVSLIGYIDVQSSVSNDMISIIKKYNEQMSVVLSTLESKQKESENKCLNKIDQNHNQVVKYLQTHETALKQSEEKIGSQFQQIEQKFEASFTLLRDKDLKITKIAVVALAGLVLINILLSLVL